MERTVEILDLDNQDHAAFMYELAEVCKADFLDDYQNDIILIMHEYSKRIQSGFTKAYLCKENGYKAGIVWVDMDLKGIAYIHAGLIPEFRGGFTAFRFLKLFVQHCFEDLGIRKIEAHLPIRNKRAERLMRAFGFKKEGLKYEATLINGEPETHVLLALTINQYKGIKNGIRRRR